MQNLYSRLLFAGSLLALAACSDSEANKQVPGSLAEVTSIHVQANSCGEGIREALAEHEFGVTDNAKAANATLEVAITSEGRNLDQLPEFGGVGSKAGYSATLRNSAGETLFSTVGDEGSVVYDELCEDIGDEIAERMQENQ